MGKTNDHRIYTLEEAQKLLKISSSTMRRLVKRGVIRAAKIGGQYRILETELLRQFAPESKNETAKLGE